MHIICKVLLICIALFLNACVTLSRDGAKVVLVDNEASLPTNCQKLVRVDAYQAEENFSSSFLKAKILLRNKAARSGASHVLIDEISEAFFFDGVRVGGMAYDCR